MTLKTDAVDLDTIGLDELDDCNGALVLGCAILEVVWWKVSPCS